VLAHPIITPSGAVTGVVAASISLTTMNDVSAQARVPAGTTLTLVDRQGRILARAPNAPDLLGKAIAAPSGASEDTVADITDGQGVAKLYATAHVQGNVDTGLAISMEVERAAALAPANSLLRRQAALLVVLLIATVAVSLLGGERFVLRPIAALGDVTRRLAAGDLSARARLRGGAPGVDELATAVNAMATEMEARSRAKARAHEDLRTSEEGLRHAQKLETVGQLAAGVAHNFNNLLTVIAGFTELLMSRHAKGADRGDLEEIKKATIRGAVLTRQLLAFSRRQDAAPAQLDLNRAITDLRDMLGRVIREDIVLNISLAASPAWVLIDPSEVEQIVLNLLLNARDAMPGGGNISIAIAHVMLDADSAPAQTSPLSGWYVRVSVTDTGTGIPPEVRAHLFEPFFTTKDAGKGTGMGLASVDGIVRQNRGVITVETEPGRGSTFNVHFPAVSADLAAAPMPPAQPPPEPVPATTTILLVEDEDPLRAVVGRMLAQGGYNVLDARTPSEACQLFEAHKNDITLLLTDVIMPEMNGPALAQRLVSIRPELRVLFVSGYTDELPVLNTPGNRSKFLPKPFSSATLLAAVADLLNPKG
jgi:signal transduction histidine kinase/CheY-like chemotaxis protein